MKTKFNYEDIKGDLEKNLLLMLKDEKTSFSKGTFNIKNHHFPSNKKEWTRVGNNTYQILIADTLFQLKYKNNNPSTKDLWIGTKKINKLNSKELNSKPNDVNYTKLKKIIENNGNTDFAIDVINSILESKVRASLKIEGVKENLNYILGKPFKYKYIYKDYKFYANFYVLLVNGEITLLRVGRDKTQVGFYDITNSEFFKESYDGREAHKIFENYLPTIGEETDILKNININNSKYKFCDSKAMITAERFWLYLPMDSCIIKNLAKGLDTISGLENDGTDKTEEFGVVYLANGTIPPKNNIFVLGEIYGHAEGLMGPDWFAGEHSTRYWIADVENPNTVGSNIITRGKQIAQNGLWAETMQYKSDLIKKLKIKERAYE